MLPFSLREPRQANPLQVPQRSPYGEKYRLTGHFILSINVTLFTVPPQLPGTEPPPCSLTGSPWAAIPRRQSLWSTFHSSIHSCTSAGVHKKEPCYISTYGEKHKVAVHGAPRRRKTTYNGVRPGFSRGSLRHFYLYPNVMQPSERYRPP